MLVANPLCWFCRDTAQVNKLLTATEPVQTNIFRHIHLIMVCTVRYSVSTYFEILPKNDNGYAQIKRWTSPFLIFS
jgi:hypothetical protein